MNEQVTIFVKSKANTLVSNFLFSSSVPQKFCNEPIQAKAFVGSVGTCEYNLTKFRKFFVKRTVTKQVRETVL